MSTKTRTLDVRSDIRNGRQTVGKILGTVKRLKKNESLRLLTPSEPVLLFSFMAAKGFSHLSRQREDGDWDILFTRAKQDTSLDATNASQRNGACKCGCGRRLLEINAQGLEPSQSLLKILDALVHISDATELKAVTDDRPIQLYAHLDERGYVGRTEEEGDSFATYIHRVKQ